MAYFLRCKNLDYSTGNQPVVMLNEDEAENYGIRPGDRVSLAWSKAKKLIAAVDVSNKHVRSGEVGLFEEIWQKHHVEAGDIVEVTLESRPVSVETIKKRMRGERVSYPEILALIKDISENRLNEIMTTYYAASIFYKGFNDDELYYVAKAMAETGETFNLTTKVVDKHSVGGLAGNRITPLIAAIIASLGIYMPKTSSRAITSPAGTADTMEVLCPVAFEMEQIKQIVKKTKACLVWGGGVKMAPADDHIIKVSRPLALESFDKMIVSIMAKKVAMGVDCLIIDVPVGKSCKVPTMKDAKQIEEKFKKLGKRFGMKVEILPTKATEPVGEGIGPALEARDVLRVLQQHKFRPMDLENKGCRVAGRLLEMKGYCKKGRGYEIAKKQITSGAAWKKLNDIIAAQGGKKDWNSEEVMQEYQRYEIHAKRSGKIKFIDNKAINEVCMNLGAPIDKYAGIHIHARYGNRVKKGDKLFTMYASSEERLKLGILGAASNVIFHIG